MNQLEAMQERRGEVLRLVKASANAVTTADVHRLYVASGRWTSQQTISADLAALERAGKVERYQAEYGHGYVWLPT